MVSRSRNKKKTNESVKRELLNLLQDIDDVEEQELNETANNVNYSQQIIVIICRYLDIIKTQSKNAIGHIGKKGEILKKFKDTEIFFDNVSQSRSMIYFKISLYKFLKKHPLLKKSTLQSSYFKNNFKAIKVVCKENSIFLYRQFL